MYATRLIFRDEFFIATVIVTALNSENIIINEH